MPRTHNPCIRRAANWKVAVCNYCALGQLDRALACCFKRIVYLSSLGEKQCLKAKRTCLDWYFRLLSDLGQQDTLLPQIANVNAQLHAVMALDRLEKGQLGYFKRHMQRTADLEPAALELFQQRIGLPPAVNAVALLGEL